MLRDKFQLFSTPQLHGLSNAPKQQALTPALQELPNEIEMIIDKNNLLKKFVTRPFCDYWILEPARNILVVAMFRYCKGLQSTLDMIETAWHIKKW
jgi:hypothetical protein